MSCIHKKILADETKKEERERERERERKPLRRSTM
jgi:hypothetical protein